MEAHRLEHVQRIGNGLLQPGAATHQPACAGITSVLKRSRLPLDAG